MYIYTLRQSRNYDPITPICTVQVVYNSLSSLGSGMAMFPTINVVVQTSISKRPYT